MEETYSADEYEDEDFESEDGHSHHTKSPKAKRIVTPHSSKKSFDNAIDWGAEDDEEDGNDDNNNADVEGQDLESYMQHYSSGEGNDAAKEDLACEKKPLDGVRPKKENAEETMLLHKLGYEHSHSNQASPQKGVRVVTNSPSPSMKSSSKFSYQSYESNDIDICSPSKYAAGSRAAGEEFPSTRTSKDNKESPSFTKQKSPQGGGNAHKVGFSLNDEKFTQNGSNDEDEGDCDITYNPNAKPRVKVDAHYIENFKAIMGTNSSLSAMPAKPSSLAEDPLGILNRQSVQKPTAEDERENAERVDALLMELFPERFEGKKGKKGKSTKKAATGGVGYSKNQTYGLAAPRGPAVLPSVEYLHSSSSHALSSLQHSAHTDIDDAPQMPLMATLDQQLKLLKRELKTKDDKITRLTEHAVMMGTHMDKLRGEAAHLTVQLREANNELEAKEARLQEALRLRKKAKKAQQQAGGGGGGGGADVAVLENENARLREREQALMDAIEELSNQNEDLIDKLKESMERELILSSKRAAQISHNVSALAEQSQQGNHHHLPQIGARAEAGGGPLRTQSEPVVTAAPKRAGRKKRAS